MKGIKIFLKKRERQYNWERYKNFPKGEKQKLVECRKNYYKTRKMTNKGLKKHLNGLF